MRQLARGMSMIDGGAWGAGLATFSGDRILEVFYPDPRWGPERRIARAERWAEPHAPTDQADDAAGRGRRPCSR